jgi:hypothetical protein
MPLYEYEAINKDGTGGERFEFVQPITADAFTVHPETGVPIRRVITAPYIPGDYSDTKMSATAKDDKKLDRLGFTKYVKAGDGTYEKRAGKGPRVITKD